VEVRLLYFLLLLPLSCCLETLEHISSLMALNIPLCPWFGANRWLGGMTTVVSIIFSDVIPLRQRGTWQGYLNIVFALGASGGAPLGGILSDTIGWRWQVPLSPSHCYGANTSQGLLNPIPYDNHRIPYGFLRPRPPESRTFALSRESGEN
jgi:MFS family permease